MSDAEEQLSTLASGQDWALDGADDFIVAAEAVKEALAGLQEQDGLESGQAADAAHAAALALCSELEATVNGVKAMKDVVSAANGQRAELARKLDALPEQPSWLASAVRHAEAGAVILTGGLSIVVGETSLAAVGSYFAQQRAAAAEEQLAATRSELEVLARRLVEVPGTYWAPPAGASDPQSQTSSGLPTSASSATSASDGTHRVHATSTSAELGNAVSGAGTAPAAVGQVGPTAPAGPVTSPAGAAPSTATRGGRPSTAGGDQPDPGSAPWVAVDAPLDGTTRVPTSVDPWSVGSAGGGSGGLAGSVVSRGLSAAGLGGTTLAGAAIASGSRAAGALGGSMGSLSSAGSLGSTSGLAAGLGRASGTPGGTGGLAGASAGTAPSAEATGAGAPAATAGARAGGSGMLGGGGGQGSSKENKRRGLGGILAPTLEDDPEATPLPASAGAGSR